MTPSATRHAPLGVVVLAFAAFIALGMPDGLLGVAWPSIRAGFGLPLDAAGALVAQVGVLALAARLSPR